MKLTVVLVVGVLLVSALAQDSDPVDEVTVEDDAVEVVDEPVVEAADAEVPALDEEDIDEIYKALAGNFNVMHENAKNHPVKLKLDSYVGGDVIEIIKTKTAPAFEAIHSATADDYSGEIPTWKQLKAEVHKLAGSDGEVARFLANLYKILGSPKVPTTKAT